MKIEKGKLNRITKKKANKAHKCITCGSEISKEEFYYRIEKNDFKKKIFSSYAQCCFCHSANNLTKELAKKSENFFKILCILFGGFIGLIVAIIISLTIFD